MQNIDDQERPIEEWWEELISQQVLPRKNPLAGSRCYLSGPIENDTAEGHNWRDNPRDVLVNQFEIDLFDPFADPKQQWVPILTRARQEKNYEIMRKVAKRFVRKDLAMVDRADFVVAYLPYKVPTTGTHHEIIMSNNNKKPTLLVCPQGKEFAPLWYYGFIPHELIFSSWEDLYRYLDEVNLGLHTNNDRWGFAYGLV